MMRRFILAAAFVALAAPAFAGCPAGGNAYQLRTDGIGVTTTADGAQITDADVDAWACYQAWLDAGYVPWDAPAAATPDELYAAKVAAGLAITSTGTPALNGTYQLDAESRNNLMGLLLRYLLTGTFPPSASTYPYIDQGGTVHTLTQAQMQAIGTAISNYTSDLVQARAILNAGGSASWPVAAVTLP